MLPNEENVHVRSSKIHLVTNSNFYISHKTPSLPPIIGIVFYFSWDDCNAQKK